MHESTAQSRFITEEQGDDIRRYASVLVTIGRNPDNPDQVESNLLVNPTMTHICSLQTAHLLRDIADRLDVRHAAGEC